MISVFIKEIKSLFRSIKNIVIVTLFAVWVGGCFVFVNLGSRSADIGALFSNCILGVLLIPPVAIDLFEKYRKGERESYLLSLPLTKLQIVLGKFFALLTFFMLPLGIAFICAFVINSVLLSLYMYIQYVALILVFALVCAFCMMVASLSKKKWAALVISYSVIVALFLFGVLSFMLSGLPLAGLVVLSLLFAAFGVLIYLAVKKILLACVVGGAGILSCVGGYIFFPTVFNDAARYVFEFLSPFGRYDAFIARIVDLSTVLFYILGTVFFVWMTVLSQSRRQKDIKNKVSPINAKAKVAALLAAVICFLPCVAIYGLPSAAKRVDLSGDRRYEISALTESYLEKLDEEIVIYAINSSMMDSYTREYYKRFDEKFDKITVREVNVIESYSYAEKYGIPAEQAGLFVGFIALSSIRHCVLYYEEMFVCVDPNKNFGDDNGMLTMSELATYINAAETYYNESLKSNDTEAIEQYADILFSLREDTQIFPFVESSFYSAVEYVTAPVVYRVVGHGEKNSIDSSIALGTQIQGLASVISSELSLKGLSEIPQNTSYIVIDSPSSDYSAEEISLLGRYLDNGGRMLVLTNASNTAMPNLLTLMAKYGLSAGENVSGEITAIWNSEKTPEVILKNASVINVSATQNVTVKKMLTEKLEEGQVSDNAKVFSAVAYKNNAAKLVWITGSDTMTLDDPKLDYMVLLYHFNNLLAGTTSSSGSQQSGVGATNADVSEVFLGSVLASDQGAVTFWGIVFVLIIPTCVCGVPFICIYKRKKNNKPQTDEN